MATVLVADGHPAFCTGICAVLAKTDDLQVAGEAHDLSQLYSLLTENPPDILLIGANLATNSLLDEVAAWQQQFVGSHLLVMFDQSDEMNWLPQLRDVAGCILKTEAPANFVRAIRTVIQGGCCVSQPLWPAVIQPETAPIPFTKREKALLPYIITDLTIQEIALIVHLSDRTVRRHLQNIYAKLGVKTRKGAVAQIVRRGLA